MICEHDWDERPPTRRQEGDVLVTEWYGGVACIHCLRLRGGNRGLVRRRFTTTNGPSGDVPEWIRLRLRDGEAELRLPDSHRYRSEAEALARGGRIDAELRYNATKRDWVVSWISAPQAQPLTPRLEQLRRQLLATVPGATWATRATIRDLETAIAITQLPRWEDLQWPEKVWNGRLRKHTKQGDASVIARRLGLEVPERGVAIWLYGTGELALKDGSQIVVDGETCISYRQAQQLASLSCANGVGFVENPDAALLYGRERGGLVAATWGALKPGHLHVLGAAKQARIATWGSFDMDPEGVRFARLALKAGIDNIEGFRAWPKSLAQDLDDEKWLILNQEAEINNHPFKDVLDYIRANEGWWEQETTMDTKAPDIK